MIKKITISIILLFCAINVFALNQRGKNLYMMGDSAPALGRGATGVSSQGLDLFYLNPASIGSLEQIGLNLQYGTLPFQIDYYNPEVTLAIPTSYFVLGTSLRYFNIPNSEDFSTGYAFNIGVAKGLTENFMIGLSFNLFFGEDGSSLYYTGGSFGFTYRLYKSERSSGFGIFDPKIGSSVHFGIPIGDNSSSVNFNAVTVGYSFSFLRFSNIDIALFNDVTAYNYSDFPVKIGLETTFFDTISLRAGYIVLNKYDYCDTTAGIGYNFSFWDIKGSLDYSVGYYKRKNYVHYLGLTVHYGALDRDPPRTRVASNTKYISPNHDGVKDHVYFALDVEDKSRIKGWRLQILDGAKNLVTEFKISEREMTEKLSLGDLFKRLFRKKESFNVPEKIMWDGTNRERKIVPDGTYYYSFNAWDDRDNIAALKTGYIVVDNTSPELKVNYKEKIFSPNGDLRKDTFIVKHSFTTNTNDVWHGGFKDKDGKIVKQYTWTGYGMPKELHWNGKDDNGRPVPEGVYDYYIYSVDLAGNKAEAAVDQISLTRKYEIADINLASKYFSFQKEQQVALFPQLDKRYGINSWKITVYEDEDTIVRELTGREFKKLVYWDCKDADGDRVRDGKYFITYGALFQSGNNPESFRKSFVVDSTAPDLDIDTSPGLFSPDGDGENDLLSIRPDANDEFGIKSWKITIYEPIGSVFKVFKGEGKVPDELKWDGYSNTGEIVESATDYYIQLEAYDKAGNYALSDKEEINIDVLVLVTEMGLKMRISNINFGLASSEIKRKGRSILNRVAQILRRYEKYSVVIEGHTDDIGKENYNLQLSEKRAKAVMNYLVDRGMVEERLSFMGMGETVPLYPNISEEYRRRNRRVEFLLQKMEE